MFLILALALVRGLLYLAVMPPWQHYDEPTHFEYIRLIADRGRLPQSDDYDLATRREIAASMQAAGFWKDLGAPTLDFWSDEPPWIGISELYHPPLYYALLALPQRLVTYQSVEAQLYLARLGSVFLNLVAVATAYGLVREAFPRRRWLPLAVAAFLTLSPPFTDLMSAVNNDVGAVAAATLFLWASVRLARRGPSPGRVGAVLLLASVCLAVKSTAGTVAAAVLLALGTSYLPRRLRLWGGLALVPLSLAATLTWGRCAAHWYSVDPAAVNRVQADAPLGDWTLVLAVEGEAYPRAVVQELSRAAGRGLYGHTVTLGAWFKAAGEPGVVVLSLDDGQAEHRRRLEVTTDWQFHAFTATVALDAPGVAARVVLPQSQDAAPEVYVDGLALVDGEMPTRLPPQFETARARVGLWGGRPVVNLLQNGSAEGAWPGLRPWLGGLTMFRTPVLQIFHSVWDWPRTAWVYGPELANLFQSFWGRFGWNHLGLPVGYFYPLGLLTVVGMVGGAVGLTRQVRSGGPHAPWQRRAWLVLGTAALAAWGGALLRIHPLFLTRHVLWPVARYAAAAIAPTAALLCLGWLALVPRRWQGEIAWLGLLGMLTLDTVALWTVLLPYYYG